MNSERKAKILILIFQKKREENRDLKGYKLNLP